MIIPDTPISTKNKLGLGFYNYNPPSTYTPSITDEDYNLGYIIRYFVGKRNYFDVIETNAKGYNLADTTFYNKISIDWKITGPEYNVYIGKTLQTTGVVNYNVLRIREADSKIKGMNLILNNPKQFWRGY